MLLGVVLVRLMPRWKVRKEYLCAVIGSRKRPAVCPLVLARLAYVFSYNKLESVFLITAITILLCGMVFQSAAITIGSPVYVLLTVLVAVLMVGAVFGFIVLLSVELYRSCKFAALSGNACTLSS